MQTPCPWNRGLEALRALGIPSGNREAGLEEHHAVDIFAQAVLLEVLLPVLSAVLGRPAESSIL